MLVRGMAPAAEMSAAARRVFGVTSVSPARVVAREPEAFTPWFLMEWQALRGQYAEQLALYL